MDRVRFCILYIEPTFLHQPADIVVLPVLFEEQVLGVIELASFSPYEEVNTVFLEQLVETIGVALNTINQDPTKGGELVNSGDTRLHFVATILY